MLLLAKMVCYTKLFMSEATVLRCKPAPNLFDECNAWDISMRTIGATVEEAILVFVEKHHPKQHRARKPFVQGIMKMIQKIPIVDFPIVNVLDTTVSSLAKSSCWYFGHISEFRQ